MTFKKGLQTLEDWLDNAKPRTFDKYLLGPFLIWYGLHYRKNPTLARRILVTAGIWQVFYAWKHYRQLPNKLEDLPKLVNSTLSKGSFILSEAEIIDV